MQITFRLCTMKSRHQKQVKNFLRTTKNFSVNVLIMFYAQCLHPFCGWTSSALGWWSLPSCCLNYSGSSTMFCMSHVYLFVFYWGIKKETGKFPRQQTRSLLYRGCWWQKRAHLFEERLHCTSRNEVENFHISLLMSAADIPPPPHFYNCWLSLDPLDLKKDRKLILSNMTHIYQMCACMVPMTSSTI